MRSKGVALSARPRRVCKNLSTCISYVKVCIVLTEDFLSHAYSCVAEPDVENTAEKQGAAAIEHRCAVVALLSSSVCLPLPQPLYSFIRFHLSFSLWSLLFIYCFAVGQWLSLQQQVAHLKERFSHVFQIFGLWPLLMP